MYRVIGRTLPYPTTRSTAYQTLVGQRAARPTIPKLLILFILLFSLPFSLFAQPALPPLVPERELFSDCKALYIDNRAPINAVAISPDGQRIVSGSGDRSIKIWEMVSGKLLQSLEGHTSLVHSVAISPDGQRIVSGSDDNSIKIWEMASGKLLQSLEGHTASVNSVAISPDGQHIVSGSGGYTDKDNSIKIWEMASGKLLQSLEGHTDYVSSVAISPDGQRIVSGSWDNSVKIWEMASGKLLQSLEGHTASVRSVAISPDGQRIVSGSGDNSIKIWEMASGKLLQSLEGHTEYVASVAISPDGHRIVSGSWDKSIKIWELASGKLLQSLDGHTETVNSVAISPDGQRIVSASWDNSIKIWEMASGKLLQSLEGHTEDVNSVAISLDGQRIVSGSYDNSVKIWEMASGKLLQSLEGHASYVSSVAISPDGKRIVSNSGDHSVKILEMASGKLLQSLEGHTSYVNSVAISPDGQRIVSGSYPNIMLWDINQTKTSTPQKNLIGGQKGCWITFDYTTQKLWRGDDGSLLLKGEKISEENNATSYQFTPVKPADMVTKDKLIFKPQSIITDNNQQTTLSLTITNPTDQPAYQIKAQSHHKHIAVQENILSSIQPQQSVDLNLSIYAHLDRENPKPIQAEDFNLTVITANGSQFNIPLKLTIDYAQIDVRSVEESEDHQTLNVEIQNSGTQTLTGAKAQLLEPFQSGVQEIEGNISVGGFKRLAFTLPEGNFTLEANMTAKLSVFIPNILEEQRHTGATKVAPLHVWHIPDIKIMLNTIAWYIYALFIVTFLALLGAIYYHRRYKNPTVLRLAKSPSDLLTLSSKALLEAQQRLTLINRWEETLERNKVTQADFDETLAFYTKPNVDILAKRIEAQTITAQEASLYRVTLPESFGLTIDNFLLYLTDKPLDQLTTLQNRSDKVLIITQEHHQDEVAKWARDKKNRMIAPTQAQLTELLLSHQSKELFVKIMAECLSFKHLSPYQTRLGVKGHENFFGRTDIVRDIITSERKNYLIVGARQLGKTAILQALERRYQGSEQVECYTFNLEYDDILDAMSTALAIEEGSTLEDIVKTISQKEKKSIFLIDEADKLLKDEKQNDYRVTSAFRKLAQEEKATFVLAGFWMLYEYVVLDYQSALKNFGELIILEGLEPEACRELMIKPMQRIGVSYEDESIIDNLIERCGYRANLIATICSRVLEGIEGSQIKQADIDKVLIPSAREALKSWEQLNPDEDINRINRIIVYLTIHIESFRLEDIVNLIEERQLPISIKQIKKSLEQLLLGYILEEHQEVYRYRIPLFVEMFKHKNIEIDLKGEIVELS